MKQELKTYKEWRKELPKLKTKGNQLSFNQVLKLRKYLRKMIYGIIKE